MTVFGAWRLADSAGRLPAGSAVGATAVGGLTVEEGRQKIQQAARPRPIRAKYLKRSQISAEYILPAKYLKPNVNSSLRPLEIAKATFWQRIVGSGGQQQELTWRANPRVVNNFYQRIVNDKTSARPARQARWEWIDNRWRLQPEVPGIGINNEQLRASIQAAVNTGGGIVPIPTSRVSAKLNSRELRERYPVQLLVDQSQRQLTVYRQGQKFKTYPVAVGQPSSPTPNGNWTILDRAIDPVWLPPEWAGAQAGIPVPGGSPDNPLVSRWLGIGDGVGIHGTRDLSSLGAEASRGCIRMSPADVEQLYEWVPVGTPLRIQQ